VARSANGVSLKAAGTGIIQSDADSVIWIPGSASLGFGNPDRTYAQGNGGPRFTFPLTLPVMLYGQKTTLKSIEISWSAGNNSDGDVHITGTRVYTGDYAYAGQIYKDNTTRSPVGDTSTYTITLNYPLDESTPGLNLAIDGIAPAHIPDYFTYIYIYGVKLRFGHN